MINIFRKKKKVNIWKELKEKKGDRGISILAPMADVTDNPFRRIIQEEGRPDLLYTEFVSCDGLASKEGRPRLLQLLNFEKKQKPIIGQIFGGKPENYRGAAEICRKLGFDGVDINMGCPQKNILKQVAGSELCKVENRELASEIIKEAKKGCGDLPLTVKTRIGFNEIDLDWIKHVLKHEIEALVVHLRTRKEMSKVPAHWELMTEIKKIRDEVAPNVVLIGNGDIETIEEGEKKVKEHGIDGYMTGRGIFKNPWLFTGNDVEDYTIEQKIELALRHTKYFEEEFGETKSNIKQFGRRTKNFNLMKKFYKVYINGFPRAKELRIEMMTAKSYEDVKKITDGFLKVL